MSRTGIITTYLVLRYVVRSGFHDTYLTFREESTKDSFRVGDNMLGIALAVGKGRGRFLSVRHG
jgi:hypothetical protein